MKRPIINSLPQAFGMGCPQAPIVVVEGLVALGDEDGEVGRGTPSQGPHAPSSTADPPQIAYAARQPILSATDEVSYAERGLCPHALRP